MRISFFALLLLLLATSVSGQPQMSIQSTEHNFGTFREDAGKQSFTFLVINKGNEPLVIQNIVASCGCTTPDWTRTPIEPGKEGTITAVYDPADRPGPFRKTLSVFSNSKPSPQLLTLTGEVRGRIRTAEDFYPWQVGSLRFQANRISFPEVKDTEKRIRVLPILNTSKSVVRIDFEKVPQYIELKSVPGVLKAGEKGIVECIYYGNKAGKWGYITDMTTIRLNGVAQPTEFLIEALITEDFTRLSKKEIENAPVFKRETTRIDLGTLEAGTVKDVEFQYENEGKRDLVIRSTWGSNICFSFNPGNDTKVQPGRPGKIDLSFNTQKLAGHITRTFYVFTNDPKSSKVAFTVEANVIPAKKIGLKK